MNGPPTSTTACWWNGPVTRMRQPRETRAVATVATVANRPTSLSAEGGAVVLADSSALPLLRAGGSLLAPRRRARDRRHHVHVGGRDYDERRATAVHEAGHAVAHVLLEVPFETVTIVPDHERGFVGALHGAEPWWEAADRELEPPSLDRVVSDAVTRLAGTLAEYRYSYRKPTRPSDWRDRWEVGAEQDHQTVVALLERYVIADERELQACLTWLHLRTKALLRHPAWASRHARVTEKLLAEETLTEQEVLNLVRS